MIAYVEKEENYAAVTIHYEDGDTRYCNISHEDSRISFTSHSFTEFTPGGTAITYNEKGEQISYGHAEPFKTKSELEYEARERINSQSNGTEKDECDEGRDSYDVLESPFDDNQDDSDNDFCVSTPRSLPNANINYPVDENHPEFKKFTEQYFYVIDQLAMFADEIDESVVQSAKRRCKQALKDPECTRYRLMVTHCLPTKGNRTVIAKDVISLFNKILVLEKNIVGVYNKTQHLEKIPLLPFSKKMPKGKMCPKKWLYFFEILQCRLDLIDDFIFLKHFSPKLCKILISLALIGIISCLGIPLSFSVSLGFLYLLIRLLFPRRVSFGMWMKLKERKSRSGIYLSSISRTGNIKTNADRFSDENLISLKEQALSSGSRKKMRDYLIYAKTIVESIIKQSSTKDDDKCIKELRKKMKESRKRWPEQCDKYLYDLMLMLLADIQDVERELMHYSNNQKKVESPEINKKPEIVAEKSRTSDKMNQKATSPKDDKIKPAPKTNLETSKNVEELDDEALEKMNVMDEDEFDKMFKEAKDLFDKI